MTNKIGFYNLLVAAALITPLVLFLGVIALDYSHIKKEKLSEANRTLDIFSQHAQNVFETHHLVCERVNERLRSMSWADIEKSAEMRPYLASICTAYPQVQAIWLADATGRVRNASQKLPEQPVTVDDRDYFRALREADSGLFIGHAVMGRVMKGINFNIAHRRMRGEARNYTGFDGIIIVTVFPEYFLSFWSKVMHDNSGVAALIRKDGRVLARAPYLKPDLIQLPPSSPTLQAIQTEREGNYVGISLHDGMERYYSVRKVGIYDAYLVHGITSRGIVETWGRNVAFYGSIFGPSCLALYLFARLARKRALLELKAEQALSQANADLESRVRERTAELNSANLRLVEEIEVRRRAEEHLLKLSSAVEQAPVSIIITDSQGYIEYTNPKFTQTTGYCAKDVAGKNPSILKSGETPAETYQELWKTITSGRTWQGEFHNLKKNGELFLEAATIAPVLNQQGEIIHFIAIKEDITEYRKLEVQLRQAQRMEAIGTLTGGVAHDFNNILTAIIGFSNILDMRMAESDPLRECVTQILAASERAANLTRSLLAFSRKQQFDCKIFDINDLVVDIQKLLQHLIREDIALEFVIAVNPLPVLADRGQIEQVLINLVTNSRDAMPNGGGLTITTERGTMDDSFVTAHGFGKPGDYALLIVTDSGMGMDDDVRRRIFDPFFTTKEIGKGTGLGLAVCYGIIMQHNGYIECQSKPGSGTTFRVYLPLAQGEAAEVKQAVPSSAQTGIETILLAEDDSMVRQLIAALLKEHGYTVLEACDGIEAVVKFSEAEGRIDLCFFDMVMPKKRGWEAFAEIRAHHPHAKALFMSGYQGDVDRLKEMELNDDSFLPKPVVQQELLSRIRKLLDA